jgi:3-methyladenine DNA glycosylase AlkD
MKSDRQTEMESTSYDRMRVNASAAPRSGGETSEERKVGGPRDRRKLERALAALASPAHAAGMARFFKTGKGQYGEGDKFLGISVPVQRRIALEYRSLPLTEIAHLLQSPWHEHRFCALEILVHEYERGGEPLRRKIFRFYLDNTAGINNWDLVDTSAPYIVGAHLRTRSRRVLDRLAKSTSLWERRIAIVATLGLVKHGEIEDTFRIARALLADEHDLMHKAVGWALRETGKVSRPALLQFLETHYAAIPRTALRYAIEHLPPEQRKQILAGSFSATRHPA